MKITEKQIDDLCILMKHVKVDLDFGAEGSYNIEKKGEWVFDSKEAKASERGIKTLKQIILNRD